MLKVKNLHVEIEGKEILKGIDLEIKSGEVHALMGPNGSGKSTLTRVIAGHPDCKITKGLIQYKVDNTFVDIMTLSPEVRAKEGIFTTFQYPIEIPGVMNRDFLNVSFHAICEHHGVAKMEDKAFFEFVKKKAKALGIDEDFLDRSLNEGLSGGEKKKSEVLQMAVLSPRLALLDEVDSGLDVDALQSVAQGINSLRNKKRSFLVITHYNRILKSIIPDYVHILVEGKIVKKGDKSLSLKLDREGYNWLSH